MASSKSLFWSLLFSLLLLLQAGSSIGSRRLIPQELEHQQRITSITKALKDSKLGHNYNETSSFLEEHLSTCMDMATKSGGGTLTIFAPPDGKLGGVCDWEVSFKSHIVIGNVDKEAFEKGLLVEGSKLVTCYPETKLEVTKGYSINYEKISDWNLYNDGYVIVHGVEGILDCIEMGLIIGGAPYIIHDRFKSASYWEV